jgi:hypothetical protein
MLQDLPFKELMLERMGIQRSENLLEDVAQTLYTYAQLRDGGLDDEKAMLATAEMLKRKKAGQPAESPVGDNPELQLMMQEPGLN